MEEVFLRKVCISLMGKFFGKVEKAS